MSAETELQRQNERLELLLNLTTRITSSLDLREVLRAIAQRHGGDFEQTGLKDPGRGPQNSRHMLNSKRACIRQPLYISNMVHPI